jgi:hypothetical protein
VRDGAILDLNWHIVTCRNFEGCIVLSGVGAQLFDGAVGGSDHENLRVTGTGHTVKNVTSLLAELNIVVSGDNNSLINVMAISGFFPAFQIAGNNNQLSDSIALCSQLANSACVAVSGESVHPTTGANPVP